MYLHCTTYLQPLLLRKQCAVHLTIVGPYLQCEGVTRNGLTVGRLAPLIAPTSPHPSSLATLAVCQRGRAIRSPLKYVSHQTMVFPDPFSLMDNALWACPKYTQPNRRIAGKISRIRSLPEVKDIQRRHLEMAVYFFYLPANPPQGGNSPKHKAHCLRLIIPADNSRFAEILFCSSQQKSLTFSLLLIAWNPSNAN